MPADFVDSNVVIYLATGEKTKRLRAREVVTAGMTISIQVLNEVVYVYRRKYGLDWKTLREFVDDLLPFTTIELTTLATHHLGLRLAERYQFSTWDAMIVAAALEAGCETLWSEDLHDGLLVDGRLCIRNPFAPRAPRSEERR